MPDDPALYARFEREGEEKVRDNLAAGVYLQDTAKLAEEWLRRHDQSRQAELASRAADAALRAAAAASRAAIAAERQAVAAERANTRTTVALIIAAITAATAIVSIMTSLHK